MPPVPCLPRPLAWLLATFGVALPLAASAGAATLTGNVSNVATGNLLAGARIEIPQLGLSALTDDTGRFVLPALPADTHDVVVSYTGLDPARARIVVTTDQPSVTRNFDLTTGIYHLDAFKVTGEREDAAAAITAQRNADNVKNVVATDSFDNLFNEPQVRYRGIPDQMQSTSLTASTITLGLNGGF